MREGPCAPPSIVTSPSFQQVKKDHECVFMCRLTMVVVSHTTRGGSEMTTHERETEPIHNDISSAGLEKIAAGHIAGPEFQCRQLPVSWARHGAAAVAAPDERLQGFFASLPLGL